MSLPRTIQTDYYRGSKLVKTNLAAHAESAVLHCVRHMRTNKYEATHAEVFDNVTGEHHSVVRSSLRGGELHVNIVFKSALINLEGV